MGNWTLTRDGDTVEQSIYNVQVTDTANPFGDFAICKIDDSGGTKFDEYSRGTRIELSVQETHPDDLSIAAGETVTTTQEFARLYGGTVANAGTYANSGTVSNQASPPEISRFTGFVVERRELDQQGADALEIEAYSYDQFLRNNTVSTDLSGKTLTNALKTIIQDDTPVSYNASNIEINNSVDITRSYRGEPVEKTLLDLSFKSQNETFGVNDSLEFFFRPRETEHIDRGVDDTNWLNYDIPELGKETRNEVEVWYNNGDNSVVVDNGQDKLDLQESLNLPEPGTQRAEIQRPNITELGDAEDEGKQYLNLRNATLTGTVTTFDLYDAEPGDTINVQISERGIDSEFTIAAVEHNWGRDETTLTIIERKGNDNSEVIVRLTEAVQRVEMEGANRDAPKNRITTTKSTALLEPTVTVDGTQADDVRVTNALRRSLRDGWIGDGTITVSQVVVGDDPTGLSRTNTSLTNQTNSGSVSETLPDATTAQYDSSVSQLNVQEVGLVDSSGTLLVRGVYDTALATNGSVSISVSVSDDSGKRSVLTTSGQTVVRDILADNSPALPDTYAYGSGDTLPTESDTALESEAVNVSLADVLIQEANTNIEFSNITSLSGDTPATIAADEIQLEQSAFTTDSSDFTVSGTAFQQDGDFSDGSAERIEGSGDYIEFDFTVGYTIPESAVSVQVRIITALGQTNSLGPELTLSLNGDSWTAVSPNAGFRTLDWREMANNNYGASGTYSGGDLQPGTYTLRIEGTSTGDGQDIDVVAPLDNRFNYTLDNSNGGSGGYLDGPELFPDVQQIPFSQFTTQRNVAEARIESTWTDTSNNQYIEVSNDGGSNFSRANNTATTSFGFPEANNEFITRIGVSRFGTQTGATPLTGVNGQAIQEYGLFINPEANTVEDIGQALTRAIVDPGTITGTTLREAGLFSGSTLLTRHVFAEFTIESSSTAVISAETTAFTQD